MFKNMNVHIELLKQKSMNRVASRTGSSLIHPKNRPHLLVHRWRLKELFLLVLPDFVSHL